MPRLMYAASGSDSDMFYATGLFIDDPFVWWDWKEKSAVALSRLEIDRARAAAKKADVQAVDDYLEEGASDRSTEALIENIIKKNGLPGVMVPEQFPAGLLEKLRRRGVEISVATDEFFPERKVKKEEEVTALSAALRVAEAGLQRGIEILRASQITAKGVLKWNRAILTSERLRAEMDSEVLRAGGIPANTIVAGGEQGCDPHERGTGPLHANEAIVLDIFPRHATSRFFGDLTRTVVRGVASEALRKQYVEVQMCKTWVIGQMRAGVDGAELQKQVIERFKRDGYPTRNHNGRWEGMFHGVGHGLGLDLHESPRFGAGKLFTGFCVTVEPGLYYPGVGGVRLEDVVVVQETGVLNLTHCPEQLEL